MNARSRFALLLVIALVALLAPETRAQLHRGRELVRAALVANTTAIVPGQPFTAGVLLRMEPHWHTYWKFPGDAGIPTEIKWKLPPGWEAGEIEWPIPLRLVEPGDIQIYGYHDEVLLRQKITPPASVDGTAVTLQAEVNWLVCEKICIPGSASVELEMPVARTAEAANEELFSRYERRLPQPWPGADVATATWSRANGALSLQIDSAVLAAHPYVDFLPLPPDGTVVGHPSVEKRDGGVTFRIPVEGEPPASLPGVAVFGDSAESAERTGWRVPGVDQTTQVPMASAVRPDSGLGTIVQFLLFGFIGGFILNLMPCVLPVISLKIFGFIQHAGQSRSRILRSGLSFVAGIFVWFIGLALLLIALKSAGRQITWAFQFTNPYFVLAMSVVVLVFALNLFGVFEVTLPQSTNRGLLAWTAREGDLGSFFQGVFATILATPCTAPFLGTALGFAFTQSSLLILLMFLAIAAGMSAPYLALSAQPAWLRFLPKPGPWMDAVKQLMGFLLLATLLFLLYVLGAERGLAAVIWTACFLLVVSVACWMRGAFLTPLSSATTRLIVFALMALLVIGSGLYFIGAKFANTRLEPAEVAAEGDWIPFSPERLKSELAQGKPVFIDFTAAWCVTCKFNKATVLETDAVEEAFRQKGVVKLLADWTNGDPEITAVLKQFGRPGVPLYVLYPNGNAAEPTVLPELLTKNMLLETLESIPPRVASE